MTQTKNLRESGMLSSEVSQFVRLSPYPQPGFPKFFTKEGPQLEIFYMAGIFTVYRYATVIAMQMTIILVLQITARAKAVHLYR